MKGGFQRGVKRSSGPIFRVPGGDRVAVRVGVVEMGRGNDKVLKYIKSIKYVTLFLANFYPLPLSHFVTHPGTPQKYVTHLGPPIFRKPNTKTRTKAPCTNSVSIVRGVFVRGVCQRGFLSGR